MRKGMTIPKSSRNGQEECIDSPTIGFMLGVAYGLQYDPKEKGACYSNIETTLLAVEELTSEYYLVFLPTEWANLWMKI